MLTVPQFVMAGVPRSGTTSLYHYLGQHPGIDLGDRKEINFLAYPGDEMARRDYPWLRFDVRTLEQYRALFDSAGDRVAVDFSASCFRSPVAIERIRKFVPEARLFVLLRDPVSRAWSAYLNRVSKGYEARPPGAALVPGERTVDNGFYSERLQAFLDAFGAERVRVWLFDDLKARPQATVVEVFEYLGVDTSTTVDVETVYNRASAPRGGVLTRLIPTYDRRRRVAAVLPAPARRALVQVWQRSQASAPALDSAIASNLRNHYRDDIRRLEELLHRDLASWRSP